MTRGQQVACLVCGHANPAPAGAECARCGELLREVPYGETRSTRPGLAAAERAAAPPRIGNLSMLRVLGRGGMGTVWLARDEALGRLVAVKFVGETRSAGDGARLRFLREARTLAAVEHPHVVRVHSLGEIDEQPYVVMEYIEGETLAARLKREGALPEAEALRIAGEVTQALGAAWERGIVHRDVKPGNILLDPRGNVRVADFGLARLAEAQGEPVTQQGGFIGTPGYASPEQAQGKELDFRSDLYSLGIVLQEMLTGHKQMGTGRPRSQRLARLVDWLTRAEATARPGSHAEVLRALGAPAPPRRGRRLAAAGGLFAAATAAVLLGLMPRAAKAPPERLTLMVADFTNETGDPTLDSLSGLLMTALDQSERLAVVPRSRTFDYLRELGKDQATRVDEMVGRELCRHAGVGALALASIRLFDEVYLVELKILDVERGRYVLALKEEVRGKANIPALIDRLSAGTRAGLSESAADIAAIARPVASMTTANLEAYKLYYEAGRLQASQEAEAIELLRKAVAIDPTFALAWWQISYLGEFVQAPVVDPREAIAEAIRHIDRAPARERLLIRAWDAHLRDDQATAAALYDRAIAEHEPDKVTYFFAGDLQFHAGHNDRALAYFEKALALDPGFSWAIHHAFDCLDSLGRTDELLALARRAPLPFRVGRALAATGDLSGARAALSQPTPAGVEPAADLRRLEELALVELLAGDGDAAARAVAEVTARGGMPVGFEPIRFWRGHFSAFDRALREAVAHKGLRRFAEVEGPILRVIVGLPPAPAPAVEDVRAMLGPTAVKLAAFTGTIGRTDDAAAREVLERLAAGDLAGALPLVAQAADQATVSGTRWNLLAAQAELAHRLGRPGEALAALRRMWAIYPAHFTLVAFYQAWSLYLEGLCQEELGNTREALAAYDRLLALWRDADPDLPRLLEARARAARLRAE